MTEDHERIEELLAGYALLSLSGQDALETDRIVTEHIPGCLRCRQTLARFQALTGDLALAASPTQPPETLLPRIRRAIEEVPLSGRRPRRGALVAVAASVAALVAMGGLSLALGGRLSDAETRAGTALEILTLMRSPGAQPVDVTPQGETPIGSSMVEVSAPDIRRLYLAAEFCPEPAPGHGYQLWLGSGGEWTPLGEMFRPAGGVVLLEFDVDVARYDELWITEEDLGPAPAEPSSTGHSWRADLPVAG